MAKFCNFVENFNIMENKFILNLVDKDGKLERCLKNESDIQRYIEELQSYRNQELRLDKGHTQVSDSYDFMNPKYKQILSLEEKDIVNQMFSTSSQLFRSDYKIDNREGRNIWNNIVLSMPKCDNRYVYRYLNEYDRMDVRVDDIITIEHSLTTTTMGRKFGCPSDYIGKYIIRCKSSKMTKAHNVSALWNEAFLALKSEKQVNFEEGTLFRIDNIKQVHGKPYIYMHEI
jgi:hypothetical protein